MARMALEEIYGANGTLTDNKSWSSPGPAAFDFRSAFSILPPKPSTPIDKLLGDVVTTPTPSMLRSIQQTTLLDDVFREDPTTLSLEAFVADLTGKEAGLLVLSGTMGNQLAIRAHLAQPPHSVLADHRSHILQYEAGGLCSLSGAYPIPIGPKNGHHLTLQDVQVHFVPGDGDIHKPPTRLISLENTLSGTILPLEDAQAIAAWARAQDPPVPVHCDGARLWEAVVATTPSPSNGEDGVSALVSRLRSYSRCFDSISLCFSKGLSAPVGSVLVSSVPGFIPRARRLRKALGGGLRQAGVIAAPALTAVKEIFLADGGAKLRRSHETAEKVAGMWRGKGGRLKEGVGWETNMAWLDLKGSGVDEERWVEEGRKEGVKVSSRGRVVCHWQVGSEGVRRLERAMDRVLGPKRDGVNGIEEKGGRMVDGQM
ncbi:MAG: hypothetical protein LQ342_004760 [Letrouitia transgressa]|nr:MAG: hypothetical protein LQ342_004760 [Letrouitia transgressa]